MAGEIYLTKNGRTKLIDEIESLNKRRVAVTEELVRAREQGDLKENAEYHAAKETLNNIAGRIVDIQGKLSRARILDEKDIDTSKVYIGVKVKIKDEDGDEYKYAIVDEEESDPSEGKISIKSPMAQGLLGHKKGEKVKITLPNGESEYEILNISK